MTIINHYNPDKHLGKQPVRVLFQGIINFYCHWAEKFNGNLLRNEITYNGLNKQVMIDIYEGPIDKIAFVDSTKTIRIEETFLSFIWTICYAQLVISEKMNPRTNDIVINPNDILLGQGAFDLFNYGMSLTKKFTKWPDNLPNPEKYKSSDAHYIERANRAFIIVTTFILYHEFAHVYLGHVDLDNLNNMASEEEYKADELSADRFAIEQMINTVKPVDLIDGQACVLMGLSTLLLFSGSLSGGTHPDPDFRVERAIALMNLKDDSDLYNIPCIGYYLWCFHFKKQLEMPEQYTNPKDRFNKINERLKLHK